MTLFCTRAHTHTHHPRRGTSCTTNSKKPLTHPDETYKHPDSAQSEHNCWEEHDHTSSNTSADETYGSQPATRRDQEKRGLQFSENIFLLYWAKAYGNISLIPMCLDFTAKWKQSRMLTVVWNKLKYLNQL